MRYGIPPRLAWHIADNQSELIVYLMAPPFGDPVALRGVGALIWVSAVEGQDVLATIAEATDQPPGDIEAEVDAYLQGLIEAGHLERRGQPSPSPTTSSGGPP